MRRLLLISACLSACACFAQTNRFPPINLYAGDPTGNACSGNLIQQSSTTGLIYTCQSGTMHTGGATGNVIASPRFSMFYQPNAGTAAAAVGDSNVTTDGAGNLHAVTVASAQALPLQLGTLYYVDSFPSSCTVGGTPYTTQLDCAAYTALATVTGSHNATLMLGTNPIYATCAGIQLINAGAMGSGALNIVGPGQLTTQIKQTCNLAVGTIYMPLVAGSAQKSPVLKGFMVNSNYVARGGIEILGATVNMVLQDLLVQDGLVNQLLVGTEGTSDGWNPQPAMNNIWVGGFEQGTGATGTVGLSGGVPTVTVTNGGSNYDTNPGNNHLTRAYLVGYQNGTSNNPCSVMGTLTPTVVAGVVTAISASGYSGCTGTVYVQISDVNNNAYGIDLEYVTDMTSCSDFISLAGYQASIKFQHGNNHCIGMHPESFGLNGIENHSYNTFYGSDFGEATLSKIDNYGVAIVSGGNVYSSIQADGGSLFRNETNGVTWARDISCSGFQTTEFHTLATPTGTFDNNTGAGIGTGTQNGRTFGNEMHNVQYCGVFGNGTTLSTSSLPLAAPNMVTSYNFNWSQAGSGTWVKLGTLNWAASAGGQALLTIMSGQGSSSPGLGTASNAIIQIPIRQANAANAPNLTSTYGYIFGAKNGILQVKFAATGGSTAITNASWDVYIQTGSFAFGLYTMAIQPGSDGGIQGFWTDTQTAASDPGVTSSSLVVASLYQMADTVGGSIGTDVYDLALSTAGIVTNTVAGKLGTKVQAGTGAGVTTGPTSSTANDSACFSDTSGTLKDCGTNPKHIKFIWFGATAGTSTVDLSTPLAQAITIDAVSAFAVTAPVTCGTSYPILNLWDSTAAASLANVTFSSATNAYTLTVTSASVVATHVLALRVSTAGVGCATNASNITMDVLYH